MKSMFAIFFLQGDDTGPVQATVNQTSHNWFLVIASVGVGIMLLGVWMLMSLGPKRRRHSHRHHRDEPEPESEVPSQQRHGSKRRRRRRTLPRNPTLAETGGLPPLRPDTDEQEQPR